MAELQDRVVELDDVWGSVVESIREELVEARSPFRAFAGMTPETYRSRREYPNDVPADPEPRVA